MASLPKKLGSLIDAAYAARNERIELQRQQEEVIKKMKEREASIEEAIIAQLQAQKLGGSKGATANATITTNVVPQVDTENGGWPAIWKWAKQNDAMDIFEKRLAKVAVRDRMEAGVAIPGVKTFRSLSLSLTKVSEK